MIGVLANPSDHAVVREFFELFKTPWEFVRRDRHYDVVISDGSTEITYHASKVVLLYAGREVWHDSASGDVLQRSDSRFLACGDLRVPIYGNSVVFQGRPPGFLIDAESQEPALYIERTSGGVLARIGYDLFSEIRLLLTVGQPAAQASVPSLEVHISIMRELIVMHGIELVEIPPVPKGYKFVVCLTHDVDHPSIRRHRLDHTMFGFMYRAIVRSVFNLVTGRGTLIHLLKNWWAAWKLPFVYLGFADDFWLKFDRYLELEGGHRSTFFVIPFKGHPGHRGHDLAPPRRAAGYDLGDIESQLNKLLSRKCEIGLHGLDAWHDAFRGHEELKRIERITGRHDLGVRMHWLYFDEQSPTTLERAGADYDSSVGFNETIGYRAGTTQAYKPFEATRLLELPLHVMDTALFYPAYLNLTRKEAGKHLRHIITNAVRFGGCVTINWHDRSISPERCWDDFYADMIGELESEGAWFATSGEVVSWFRKRRAITFDHITSGPCTPNDGEVTDRADTLPGLQWQIHNPQQSEKTVSQDLNLA
jgi:hypothetical protein